MISSDIDKYVVYNCSRKRQKNSLRLSHVDFIIIFFSYMPYKTACINLHFWEVSMLVSCFMTFERHLSRAEKAVSKIIIKNENESILIDFRTHIFALLVFVKFLYRNSLFLLILSCCFSHRGYYFMPAHKFVNVMIV